MNKKPVKPAKLRCRRLDAAQLHLLWVTGLCSNNEAELPEPLDLVGTACDSPHSAKKHPESLIYSTWLWVFRKKNKHIGTFMAAATCLHTYISECFLCQISDSEETPVYSSGTRRGLL